MGRRKKKNEKGDESEFYHRKNFWGKYGLNKNVFKVFDDWQV